MVPFSQEPRHERKRSQLNFRRCKQAFNGLTVQGVDSGTTNAYAVTVTSGGPTGAYQDGNIVEFAAGFANTGPSTIAVNGLGVTSWLRGNGAALQSGDVGAGQWSRSYYSSTSTAWMLAAPMAYTSIGTGVVSGAAPTNKVGLTAAGGVSSSVVPIDAKFAIDQTIAPTWTAIHNFSSGIRTAGANIFTAP